MVRVNLVAKDSLGNRGISIYDDGDVYFFDATGRFSEIRDKDLPMPYSNMVEMPIISVLSCKAGVEVALFDKDEKKIYTTEREASEIAMKLFALGDFTRMLRRDGKIETGETFNQALFLYKAGFNAMEKIKGLDLVEVV